MFLLTCIAVILSEVGHLSLSLLAICIFPPTLLKPFILFYDLCVFSLHLYWVVTVCFFN